jgi:hypothetical protein
VFVGLSSPNPDGTLQLNFAATAFLVHLPFRGEPNRHWMFLVTARHVAERLEWRDWAIRINTNDGNSRVIAGNNAGWWYHPFDPKVDVAILNSAPDRSIFNIRAVSVEMFATDEVMEKQIIGIGDEVFVTGLFSFHSGTVKNTPIVRTGNLTMTLEERVPTARGVIEAYLIEARSIGGVSGSLLFVRPSCTLNFIKLPVIAAQRSFFVGAYARPLHG